MFCFVLIPISIAMKTNEITCFVGGAGLIPPSNYFLQAGELQSTDAMGSPFNSMEETDVHKDFFRGSMSQLPPFE